MSKEDVLNYIDQVKLKRVNLLKKINDNEIVSKGLDVELTEFDTVLMQMIGYLEDKVND